MWRCALPVVAGRAVRRAVVSWVVLGPEPYLATCQRCGALEPKPELPASVDAVVLYLRYVMERHRYCGALVAGREGSLM